MPRTHYTDDEEDALARALRRRDTPLCPRCRVAMDARSVPPRPEVSYVRDRTWLVCPSCKRQAVIDRRRTG